MAADDTIREQAVDGGFAAIVATLRDPVLRRLVIAFLISEIGDGMTAVVLPLSVFAATGSATLTGGAFAIVRLINVVGRPTGGVLADRFDRLRVLRSSFVVRALLLVVAATFVDSVTALALVALLGVRVGAALDNAAAEAAIRVRARHAPQQVAAVRRTAFSLSFLVGPALGGLVLATAGLRAALVVDLATFVLALVVLGGMRSPVERAPSEPAVLRHRIASVFADVGEGVRHLRGHPDLRVLVGTAVVNATLVAAVVSLSIPYLDGLVGAPDGAYGFALAAYGIGELAGSWGAGAVRWKIAWRRLVWRSLLAYGVICILSVAVASWWLLIAGWLVWGISFGPERILGEVALVTATDDALLGRAYGGLGMLESMGLAVGSIAGGVMAEVAAPRAGIVVVGVAYVVAAPFFLAAARRASATSPSPSNA